MGSQISSPRTNVILFGSLFFFVSWYIITSIYAWRRLRHIPSVHATAGFSYIWRALATHSGRQHWIHRDLHVNLGPLVRVSPNEIMTDDPAILRHISSTKTNYHRDPWYTTGRFNPYYKNMFTHLDPAGHTKARAKLVPAYSGRETPALEPGVDDQVRTLVELLKTKYAMTDVTQQKPLLDLAPLTNFFTLDVITRAAFGQEFGFLEKETDHYNILKVMWDLWPWINLAGDIPWIRGILFSELFLTLAGPKETDKTGFGALMGMANMYVRKRFEPGAKQEQDMLGSFIRHGLSKEACEAEGLFMVLAGSESSAIAIRTALIHTIATPRVYQALKQEIKLAIQENRVSHPISADEAKKLPYLQAVVYEGLRMRPPVIGLLPKVVPPGGETFHGKFIPAGTAICTNMSAMQVSPAVFGANSDVFMPERFMQASKEARSQMERDAELCFGYGQWGCVGKNVAFMEMNKVIFEMMREFDFQIVGPTEPNHPKSYGAFLEKNMLLRVTPTL